MNSIRFWDELCANVWPAFAHILYDGWLLRFTPGYARNNNCVWPLYQGERPLEEKIDFCEQQYSARGSTCGFRLSVLPGHQALEGRLIERGYIPDNPNLVMARDTIDALPANITELTRDDWLETAYRIHPVDDPGLIDWERQVLQHLALPCRFAVVMWDDQACGYGCTVRQGNILYIADLWTLPERRGQGLGTQLIRGLMQLGLEDGADSVFLAVNEPNDGARRLYERLGFRNQYVYRYLIPKE